MNKKQKFNSCQWDMDAIQFPRLLAEIMGAVDLDRPSTNLLCQNMDLEEEQITDLFDRADKAWQGFKGDTNRKGAPKGAPYAVVLDHTFSKTERGNIWLVHVEENYHNAWIRLPADMWLEVSIRPDNYPGLSVQLVRCSEEDLAKHIRKYFGGHMWIAKKMNIAGVTTTPEGYINES